MEPAQKTTLTRRSGTGPSRRGFVTGSVLVGTTGLALAAGGCALNNPFDDTPTPAPEAVANLDPDVGIAALAATAIGAAQQVVTAAISAYPGLSGDLAGLQAMHTEHLAALADAVPDGVDTEPSATPPAAQPSRGAERALVVRQEQDLHATLTALALRAESGLFARLLGSMAASVSQHLAVLAG